MPRKAGRLALRRMGGREIRRHRPNSPRRPRPDSPPPPRNSNGARTPKDDGPSWRNHVESPPPDKTISSDPNRGWGPSGALRHVREAVGPAMACVKKAAVGPSVSAVRGEEGPINRRGAARAAPGPWRLEIMDNPPNRHCARRPPSRPLLEEEAPISGAFTVPPRGPRGDENMGEIG